MRGTNYLLALTTTTDEITGEVKPLFAFPVQICKARSDDTVRFEVAAPSGAKRKQCYVDPMTGEVVEDADCPRGVFVGDEFKPVPAEAIAAITAETKLTTMVAAGHADLAGLREEYGNRIAEHYYLQNPTKGGSAKAYRLTYEALRAEVGAKGKVKVPAQAIVVKRTKSTKQALGFIYADEAQGCLAMCEVVFNAAVRDADEQVKAPVVAAEVEQAQIDMARKVIAGMADGREALDTEYDEANDLKADLIEQAINGEGIEVPTPMAVTVENADLGAMLAASLA